MPRTVTHRGPAHLRSPEQARPAARAHPDGETGYPIDGPSRSWTIRLQLTPHARRRLASHINKVSRQRPAVPPYPPAVCRKRATARAYRTFHLYEDEQLHTKRLSHAERRDCARLPSDCRTCSAIGGGGAVSSNRSKWTARTGARTSAGAPKRQGATYLNAARECVSGCDVYGVAAICPETNRRI
jgi:hypothetical protein